ncbi:multiple sugar transport system substrate-binding protein [Paenibacillus endophyticus]|uniref:Multiple sugar transport system substrate-binding protein n=1 Tax=Paenibacillus endophyticus TaxID=1294268 RepID=A0A7W5C559_9BACL|nr:sugar ABC transporter substrate-binding protein [Paenibacillus endophyticus]MBB3151370.1 multiple sugar transport system substrate-binding protein [Paenibacillus endophyticus]
MNTKSKWLSSAWIMVLAMAIIFTGCGNNTNSNSDGANKPDAGSNGNSASTEPVTITYSQWGTAEELLRTQELLNTFMAANKDIKVKLEGKDWGSYWDGLTANAAGGTLPDVFKTSYAYIEKYAELGIFKELDSLLTANAFDLSNIDESLLGLHKYQDKQVSLPIDANVIVWYYNTALFNDSKTNPYGASTPSLEPTWEEIVDIATKMTLDKNGKNAGDADFDAKNIAQWGMSISPGSTMDWFLEPELWSNGAKLVNEDGSLALDTPEALEVLNFFIDLTKNKKINTTPAQIEGLGGQVNLSITTGKVAMNPGGNWNTTNYKEAGIKYGIAYLPKFKTNQTVVQPAGMAISANTKHEDAAVRLLSWLAGPEGQTELAKQGYSIPANKAAADAYIQTAGNENQIFLDAQQYGIISPFTAKKTDLVWTYGEQALKLPLSGEGDLQAAISDLASKIK